MYTAQGIFPHPFHILSIFSDSATHSVKWDPNTETASQIQAWLDAEDTTAIEAAFGSRLSFGTAGLRGPMGPGTACMNELTVMQAAQGLVAYLVDQLGESEAQRRGLVIGYDHRARGTLNSQRFAVLTAAIALHRGFAVYISDTIVATPIVVCDPLTAAAGSGCIHRPLHTPPNPTAPLTAFHGGLTQCRSWHHGHRFSQPCCRQWLQGVLGQWLPNHPAT